MKNQGRVKKPGLKTLYLRKVNEEINRLNQEISIKNGQIQEISSDSNLKKFFLSFFIIQNNDLNNNFFFLQ
jgi:uncharacterized protein Veg